jgi:acetylornithine/N-succinyldiaminopimelate aminotransferase
MPETQAAIGTDWTEEAATYLMATGRRQPLTIVRGAGTYIWDDEGRRYLDFLAGIAVVSLGHCSPVVVEAIKEQAENLILASNNVYTLPQVELAKLLCELSGLSKVYFSNGGAEANEAALKLARKWGKLHKDGAYEVIATENGFHGRTMGTIAATGTARYREPFEPLAPGFSFVPFGDVAAIKEATSHRTCAIILEPIQGEAGVNIPAPGYLCDLRAWCDEQDIALILDEVQTGIGRTGLMFACERESILPDIMTLAKGLGGGVPIGATLVNDKLNVFEPGDHGTTFGGNNLSTGVALAVLRHIVDSGLVDEVAAKGEYMLSRLRGIEDRHALVKEVRGLGLLCAIELKRDVAGDVMKECIAKGLLLSQVRDNILRLIPPLTVSREELDEATAILDEALTKIG